MAEPVLRYRSGIIEAKLARSRRTLLKDVCFAVGEGESLALIGETGSGKTMTALSVMALLPANVQMTGGSVILDGRSRSEKERRALLGKEIVYIPQNGLESLNPSASVRTQLFDSLAKLGVPRREREAAAAEKLRLAGFEKPESILPLYPFELSGGMAQRVTIALSACSEARLIIADEPTNGLDEKGRANFLALLHELFPRSGRLIITHDMGVAELCERTLVLCGGRAMEQGESAEVLTAPRQPYTAALLGSLVKNGMKPTPTLRAPAGDCPFFERCPRAGEACLGEIPTHSVGGREWRCAHD